MKLKYPEAEIMGHDYGLPFSVKDGEDIIMADVSLPMDEMKKTAKNRNFTIIDHHISFIKEYEKEEPFLTAVLDNTLSACEGTWRYLFHGKPTPKSVTLLGEYDTWRNNDKERWENEILPFQFGMREICNSVDSFPVVLFDTSKDFAYIDEIIQKGKTILSYQAKVNELNCKKAFESTFEGMRAICLNGSGFSSDTFKSVYNEDKHDVMMPFQFNGKEWVVSMYTTKDIDLSIIAKKWGGGGHAKACGFQVDSISRIFPNIK